MKAITLWQPWAWLIFVIISSLFKKPVAAKRIETRSWKTSYRGRLAIHSAKFHYKDKAVYNKIRCAIRSFMEVSQIVESVIEGNTPEKDNEMKLSIETAITQLYYLENGIPGNKYGSVIGTVNLIDCVPIESLYGTEYDTVLERACGDWSPGRFGWILSEPELFKTPIPARGNQGFWNWEREDA